MPGSEPARVYVDTRAGRLAQRRHEVLVGAVREALRVLQAPFSEHDEIPGTIQDAIDLLRAGLR